MDPLALWKKAEGMDSSLKLSATALSALKERRVYPERFSRRRLFEGMLRGEIRLFHSLPVPFDSDRSRTAKSTIVPLIRSGFPRSAKANVQTGPSRTRHNLTVGRLMDRWEGGRAIISVTDLHIRGTRFGRAVNTSALSDFNILANSRSEISDMEMMTVLVGSAGNVTDSHTDDCDGSNHCFVGKKLWLMWDRIEGQMAGLQDVERDPVTERAAFNMRAFLSLTSARWLIIGPGETLFLPGNLAHKVLTIAHYIGVGSFYLAFPNSFRSFTRWALDGTIDINQSVLLEKMIGYVTHKISSMANSDRKTKQCWGWHCLGKALALWNERENPKRRMQMLQNPAFARFVAAVAVASNVSHIGSTREAEFGISRKR